MRSVYLCDFDGTVSPADIGAAFVREFSPGRETERRALLERWKAGELGHRSLTVAELALVRAGRDEALAFTRGFTLDPAFAAFVKSARAQGDDVMVVSEGFDFYVDDLLDRAGLSDVPRATNRVHFAAGRVDAEFPHGDAGCGACGNCKAQHVRRYRDAGYRTVFVGDGLSDRCGASAADAVFARAGLLAWCRENGIEVTAFERFADVMKQLNMEV